MAVAAISSTTTLELTTVSALTYVSKEGDVMTLALTGQDLNASIFTGMRFNSHCVKNNISYIADFEGIHELGGNTDNGKKIHTVLRLSKSNYKVQQRKRPHVVEASPGAAGAECFIETEKSKSGYIFDSTGKLKTKRVLSGINVSYEITDFTEIESLMLVFLRLQK